jgi:hypothetical protein
MGEQNLNLSENKVKSPETKMEESKSGNKRQGEQKLKHFSFKVLKSDKERCKADIFLSPDFPKRLIYRNWIKNLAILFIRRLVSWICSRYEHGNGRLAFPLKGLVSHVLRVQSGYEKIAINLHRKYFLPNSDFKECHKLANKISNLIC